MQVKQTFLELGDPVKVSKMLELLKINIDDFFDPRREVQIKELIQFLNKHPDPEFFVRKAIGSKNVDRVEFMHEYMTIHNKLTNHIEQLALIEEKISEFGTDAEQSDVYWKLQLAKEDTQREKDYLLEEITIYEK